jgi:lipopolysaccharide export system protein LptA
VRFDRRPPVAPAPDPAALPKDAAYQSTMADGGRQCRTDNGKEVSCISYAKSTQFTDGHTEIERPVFQGDRGGKPFTISADRGELRATNPNAESNEIPAETHLIGNVVMREQDGIEIKTDDATFQEQTGTLTISGPLTFHRDRLTGSGVGASYKRDQELLNIDAQAKVLLAADETGHGKLDGQSTTMELNRALHSLVLTGNAVVVRDQETIRTDLATMHLTDDEQGIAVMQLRGHSGIIPLMAAGNDPEMHGDDIDLEFYPDGRTIRRALMKRQARLMLAGGAAARRQVTGESLDVTLAANGQSVLSLTGTPPAGGVVEVTLPATSDAPRRVIRSLSLTSSGTEAAGLESAVFQKNVVFTEDRPANGGAAAVDRQATARQLVLTLKSGDIGNIDSARFRDGVRFRDGATVGVADDVNYLASKNALVLRPSGAQGHRSEVDADRINVKARNIDIGLDKTTIVADGDVVTETKPQKDAKASGLFDDTKPINGKAATLHYSDDSGVAVYTGDARLWQGAGKEQNRIQADEISVDDTAGTLSADGHVVTALSMSNVENGNDAPKSTAAKLRFSDATHRAVYTGTEKEPAQFTGPDGMVNAGTIDLTLSTEGRELVRMVADRSVAARVSAEQTARGDHLDYDVKTGRYVLDGPPARIIRKTLENGAERCSQSSAIKMIFTKAADGRSQEVSIGTTGTGTATTTLLSCQDWTIK